MPLAWLTAYPAHFRSKAGQTIYLQIEADTNHMTPARQAKVRIQAQAGGWQQRAERQVTVRLLKSFWQRTAQDWAVTGIKLLAMVGLILLVVVGVSLGIEWLDGPKPEIVAVTANTPTATQTGTSIPTTTDTATEPATETPIAASQSPTATEMPSPTPTETATEIPTATDTLSASPTIELPALVSTLIPQITISQPTKTPIGEDADLVAIGIELYKEYGCGGCHELDVAEASSSMFGPTNNGMAATAEERIIAPNYAGEATTAKEYLLESIVEPSIYIVEGYTNLMPPMSLPDDQLNAIVEMLMSN